MALIEPRLPVRRIDIDRLLPGDIVLTASRTSTGKVVRLGTGGSVSHAMLCVQHGSVIDSTSDGVQASNLQRVFFEPGESVFAFRLRDALTPAQLRQVVDYARSQIGVRYSILEAARSAVGVRRPRHRRQFCSRLVAQAYAQAGVPLVADRDYCTPEDLRGCNLLIDLGDVTEQVDEAEVAAWRARPDPIARMKSVQNAILAEVRRLDPTVEHFGDVDRVVREHPEHDEALADAFISSGYLELWRHDLEVNPWHYDIEALEAVADHGNEQEIRSYCQSIIREHHSGGARYAAMLAHHRGSYRLAPRRTTSLLIALYERLVANDQALRDTAFAWLERHYPSDIATHMERVEPHSELWFDMVDRAEPRLGALARLNIAREGSAAVCSSCGDPGSNYLLMNAATAMPGVPSLRLCSDCLAIRRNFGELLEPFR